MNAIPLEDSFSPLLHRIEQAIRWRAVHPNEPLSPPSEKLVQFSKPPADVQERAKKYLDRVIKAADVKKGNKRLVQQCARMKLTDCHLE